MSFMDGKSRIATETDCQACWSGGKPGERFRCYLCGIKFKAGDTWAFVYDNDENGSGYGNFLVCELCDAGDVRGRWKEACQEAERRFWWLMESDTWTLKMGDNYHYRNAENYKITEVEGSSCQLRRKDPQ
jgi:hypothetical protein